MALLSLDPYPIWSSTPVASTHPPLPTAAFRFDPIPSISTCTEATITWTFSGPSDLIVGLLVANATAPRLGGEETGSEIIVVPNGEVFARAEDFRWDPTGFASGWYVLLGRGTGIDAQTAPFMIDDCATPSDSTSTSTSASPSTPTSTSPSSSQGGPSGSIASAASGSGSAAPQTLPSDTLDAGNKHAAVVAGVIIAAVTVLITVVVAFLCFSTARCRRARARAASPPQGKRRYHSARWLGLSSSHSTLQADPDPDPELPAGTRGGAGVGDKPRLSVIEMPRPALPRLEPNRRQPSVYIPSPVATSIVPPSPSEYSTATAKRGDSPTSLANSGAYRTRKPVPPLDLVDTCGGGDGEQGFGSEGGRSPGVNSAVPSSATSRMYRTRDSLQTQATSEKGESWRARASSIIDPHQFGAMKTMHTVVPDVPPLPSL